jgi:NAD(P)-dependent dehydrogenase (short-subunit alcohol dehydrogenase family)
MEENVSSNGTSLARLVAVVTGGSSGVGRATARAFADEGYAVAVLARGQDSLDATRRELEDRGVPALGISVDVTDRRAVDAAADRVEAELGPINVWVNSAMVTVLGEFSDIDPDDFDRVVDVVFKGTANGTRTALRCMTPRDSGRIIEVGSALAYRGIPLQSAYCASKHAVQGMCDSLRAELLHRNSGITLSEVNLPAVNTPQFDMCKNLLEGQPMPVPPIFQPEVAAAAILHAAKTGDRSLNVTFSTTRAVMGNRVAPGALDQLLADTGYSGQVSHRTPPPRPQGGPSNNLYEPIPGDHGCHGSFDSQAMSRSRQEALRFSPLGSFAEKVGSLGRKLGGKALKPLV